jgi:hypothetical protein
MHFQNGCKILLRTIETFSARPVLEKDPEGISVDPSPGDDRLRIAKSGTPEPHDSAGLDNYLI